jgi:hypothetical protein
MHTLDDWCLLLVLKPGCKVRRACSRCGNDTPCSNNFILHHNELLCFENMAFFGLNEVPVEQSHQRLLTLALSLFEVAGEVNTDGFSVAEHLLSVSPALHLPRQTSPIPPAEHLSACLIPQVDPQGHSADNKLMCYDFTSLKL